VCSSDLSQAATLETKLNAPTNLPADGVVFDLKRAASNLLDKVKNVKTALNNDGLDGHVALQDAAAGLPDVEQPAEGKEPGYCDAVARVKWYSSDAHRTLLSRYELPLKQSIAEAPYAAGAGSASDLEPRTRLAVLVTGVPTGEVVSASMQQEARVGTPLEIIARVAPAFAGEKAKLAGLAVSQPPAFKKESKCATRLLADTDVDPLAPIGTRAFLLPPLDDDYTSKLFLCSGPDCATRKDDKPVRNTIALDVLPEHRFAVLVELAMTAPLHVKGKTDLRYDSFAEPRFDPVGGVTGPDQLFQLRYITDVRQLVSTSILLGVQHHHTYVGFGPSLWLGGSSSLFTQWNLRVGWAFTKGVLLTVGPTLRVVPRPIDYAQEDVVAVPRPATGDPAAPTIRTHDTVAFGASLGIAIDLAALADAGDSLLKSIGMKK